MPSSQAHPNRSVLIDSLEPSSTSVLELTGFLEPCGEGRGKKGGARRLAASGLFKDPEKHGWDSGDQKYLASIG